MDLAGLGSTFEANKLPILGAAAAGVVGLALYRRHKGGTAPAGSAADSASAGGQVAGVSGANAYDSTSSDVYGLIQPQLESLGNQLTSLQDKLNQTPVSKPPAPAPTPAPKPPPKVVHHDAGPPLRHVPIPAPKRSTATWVTVNRGDTLSGIAARYKSPSITPSSIYNLNRSVIGSNPNLIRPGEKLRIG